MKPVIKFGFPLYIKNFKTFLPIPLLNAVQGKEFFFVPNLTKHINTPCGKCFRILHEEVNVQVPS